MEWIEHISSEGKLLATIVRAETPMEKTNFLTDPERNLQVGSVVYPAGGTIARHVHRPLKRQIVGTSEVIFVKKGRCRLDVYDDRKRSVTSRELRTGDILIMIGGGHGFQVLEDTILLEVKQGPYTGLEEKERF